MSNDDISHLLNSFSISTSEEKLTHQLDQTHIDTNKAPSIFTVPKQQSISSQLQQQQQQWQSSNNQGWIPNENESNNQNQQQQEEGWGDAPPSYTTISQGTYFGFNSIMQPEIFTENVNNSPQNNTNAFSKYKNKPVTFNSALKDNKNI